MNVARVPSHESDDLYQQLTTALVLGASPDDALRLVCRLWQRETQARSVMLAVVATPSAWQLAACRRDDAGTLVDSLESIAATPGGLLSTSLLSSTFLSHAGAGTLRAAHRHWLLPDVLAAVVVDEGSGGHVGTRRTYERCTAITRRLLQLAPTTPLLVPDSERLASLAEFAAGAGHEINNPLGSIVGQAQLLLRRASTIAERESLETIGAQAWRIRDMIGDTMLFARPPVPQIESHDLVELCQSVLASLNSDFAPHGQTAVLIAPEVVQADVDRDQWSVLLSHLIRNAFESQMAASELSAVRITLRSVAAGDAVEILVRDQGTGIQDATVRRHLFDPFYSGRQAGRGLGFGLCLAWQIARNHHGLLAGHLPDRGAEFCAAIPSRRNRPS